ncbi:uncharacterized protein LY89DRAFT_71959 [Mollisia scopiformis]|uniref:Uncharacterized protein n=1 Tax=Mollisia scopiformis TaxID=149040 RepID=A0A194XAA0_MOLSC|nr:uncharacterized protein LY89DRAFT_71959 [Mollisia scopiformis]KUJ17095.1 hypothetical protein LY89DRAFT_71959 [Mollisia scopiformis]
MRGSPLPGFAQMFYLFQRTVDISDPFDIADSEYFYVTITNSFQWTFQTMLSSCNDRGTDEIVQFLIRMLKHHGWKGHANNGLLPLVKFLLEGRDMKLVCKVCDDKGFTLLSRLLRLLSMATGTHEPHRRISAPLAMENANDEYGRPKLSEIFAIASTLIQNGSDLHALSMNWGLFSTPMLNIMCGSVYWWNRTPVPGLMSWLHLLKRCTIDLEEYGRMEKHIHLTLEVKRSWRGLKLNPPRRFCGIQSEKIKPERPFEARLVNFVFGPEPDDWQFWFTHDLERWFCDFWEMIEHPERGMPGSWTDFAEDKNFHSRDHRKEASSTRKKCLHEDNFNKRWCLDQ